MGPLAVDSPRAPTTSAQTALFSEDRLRKVSNKYNLEIAKIADLRKLQKRNKNKKRVTSIRRRLGFAAVGEKSKRDTKLDSDLPVFFGLLNNFQISFLADSGAAGEGFVTEATVRRLGLKVRDDGPPIAVEHSNGHVERTTRWVSNVHLKLGTGWVSQISAVVVKDLGPDVDFVIGLQWLRRYRSDLKLREAGDRLELTLGTKRVELHAGVKTVSYASKFRWNLNFLRNRRDALAAIRSVTPEELCFVSVGMEPSGLADDDLPAEATALGTQAPLFDANETYGADEVLADIGDKRAWYEQLEQEFPNAHAAPNYDNRVTHPMAQQRLHRKLDVPLPSKQAPRPLSSAKLDALRQILTELVAKGYITPSKSEVASPILLVPKPDGSWRLTIDYRLVNTCLRDDLYRPPNAREILKSIPSSARLFSRIDAKDGFWGCEVDPRDRWLTAFQTRWGMFEWTVSPMGLKTSPANFQRLMDTVLQEYVGKTCLVFIDDILIFADTEEQMRQRVREILTALESASIHVKASKCAYCLRAVRFLGNIVDQHGVHPDRSKVTALIRAPQPKSLKDVRSLYGAVVFLQQFIPQAATSAEPITRLLGKGTPFYWGHEQQRAYAELLMKLATAPTLVLPRADQAKAIMTDASAYAAGAVLLQWEPSNLLGLTDHPPSGYGDTGHGSWHPIAYLSKRFTPAQARQSPTVREFFAIDLALQRWEHEIYQSTVQVFTDHEPLESLSKQGTLNDMIMRRLDRIMAMGVDIKYIRAEGVGMADFLSRWHTDKETLEAEQIRQPIHPMLERFRHTGVDGLLSRGIALTPVATRRGTAHRLASQTPGEMEETATTAAVNGDNEDTTTNIEPTPSFEPSSDKEGHQEPPKTKNSQNWLWPLHTEFLDEIRTSQQKHADSLPPDLRDIMGIKYITVDEFPAIVIPSDATLRNRLLGEAHDSPLGGHQGTRKTLRRLRRYVYWPGIAKDVKQYCESCPVCQSTKRTQHALNGLRWPLPIPLRKWSWVAWDFVSLPVESKEGYNAVLVVVDKLTKRVRFLPCYKTTDATETARLYYQHIWKHHGFPMKIVSDRGPQFAAEVMRKLWELTGTRMNLSTAYHAQTDGQGEKGVDILSILLRCYSSEMGDNWAEFLPSLEYAYNDSEVRTHGYTPFELEYGQSPSTPLALSLGVTPEMDDDPEKFLQNMQKSLRAARESLKRVSEAAAGYENKKRRALKLKVGQEVYVAIRKKARRHKLSEQWDGPYPVVAIPSPNVVKIAREGNRHDRVNVEHIRIYREREVVEEEEIKGHRVRTAEDGCEEMQYRRYNRYWPLRHLVRSFADGWTAVQEYHRAHGEAREAHHVGELVWKDFDGDLAEGRIEYFDPDDKNFSVVYYDGFCQLLTAKQYQAQAKRYGKGQHLQMSPMTLPGKVADTNTMLKVALLSPPSDEYAREARRLWPRANVKVFPDAAEMAREDGRTKYDLFWASTTTATHSLEELPADKLVWGLVSSLRPRIYIVEGERKSDGPGDGRVFATQVGRRLWVWTNVVWSSDRSWEVRGDRAASLATFTELMAQVKSLPSRSEWTLRSEHFEQLQAAYGP